MPWRDELCAGFGEWPAIQPVRSTLRVASSAKVGFKRAGSRFTTSFMASKTWMNGKSYWKSLIPCLGFWARGEELTPPRARGGAIPRHRLLNAQAKASSDRAR